MKKVILTLCAIAFCGAVTLKAEDAKKTPASKEDQFKKADTNGDGVLSEEEFVAAFGKKDAEKAKERFKKLDKKGDGKLTLEEFSAGGKKKAAQ
jgi:Ca2+-binding EF-hand superfamily protein